MSFVHIIICVRMSPHILQGSKGKVGKKGEPGVKGWKGLKGPPGPVGEKGVTVSDVNTFLSFLLVNECVNELVF